jgi:hypothetical protein
MAAFFSFFQSTTQLDCALTISRVLCFSMLLLVNTANGQSNLPLQELFINSPEMPAGVVMPANLCDSSFYENDFSDCDSWVVGSAYDSGLDDFSPTYFQCGIGLLPEGSAIMETIASETVDNGYAMITSNWFNEGLVPGVLNTWIQSAEPVDCSDHTTVLLSVQTFYRLWDGGVSDGNEYCLLEVSRDGTTWPDISTYESVQGFVDYGDGPVQARWEFWPEMESNDPLTNPSEVVFDITSIAGAQEEIWVRFRYKGDNFSWPWMIDDLKLSEVPQSDVAIFNYYSLTDFYNTGVFPYGVWPESQTRDIQLTSEIVNYGQQTQSTVTLNAIVNGELVGADTVFDVESQSVDTLSVLYSMDSNPGDYSIGLQVISGMDDCEENNSISLSYEVSEFVFARDNGVLHSAFPESGYTDAYIASVPYQFAEPDTIYGIQFPVVSGDSAAPLLAHILDPITKDFVLTSPVVDLNPSLLNDCSLYNDISWHTIAFDQPFAVDEGEVWEAAFAHTGNSSVQIGQAQKAPQQTSFVFGDFGTAGVEWYTTRRVPMIRFLLDPEATSTSSFVSGCLDPLACNYAPDAEELEICIYPGCSDPQACNYDANLCCSDDSSCVYPPDVEIIGSSIIPLGSEQTYFFEPTDDVFYSWSVQGGTLLSEDDSTLVFFADVLGVSEICVTADSTSCESSTYCLMVSVISEDDIQGCTDEMACNYNVEATVEDNSCIYTGDYCNDGDVFTSDDIIQPSCECSGEGCTEIFFSEYLEGFGNDKALELYNPSPDSVSLQGYYIQLSSNGGVPSDASTWPYSNPGGFGQYRELTGVIPPYGTWLIVNGQLEPDTLFGGMISPATSSELLSMADQFIPNIDSEGQAFYFQGDDAIVLIRDSIMIDLIGRLGEDPGISWSDDESTGFLESDDEFAINTTRDVCLRRKVEINRGVQTNPEFFNAFDSWELYDVQDWAGFGWHESNCLVPEAFGCTDESACNYSIVAVINDDTCLFEGDSCDDGNATTTSDAIQPDCTCEGVIIYGCMDDVACNYNPEATVEDDSCQFVGDSCDDGNAITTSDAIQPDCTCEGVIIYGCMDDVACNYNPEATVEDDSCLFVGDGCDDGNPETIEDEILADCNCGGQIFGCTDPEALNYNPEAVIDDNSCTYTLWNEPMYALTSEELVSFGIITPQPGIESVILRLTGVDTNNPINISIYDMAGRLILHQTLFSESGLLSHRFNISSFASGHHFVHIVNGQTYQVLRLIKAP